MTTETTETVEQAAEDPWGAIAAKAAELAERESEQPAEDLRAVDRPRELPMAGQVLAHVVGMCGDSDGGADPDELRMPTENLELAMVVTSTMARGGFAGQPLHRPVLDLDMDVRVVPSTTPGHHHLYIDRPMTWDRYVKLLDALAEVGLLEGGYVSAAKYRGHTAVRVPWLRKGDPAPRWPEAEVAQRVHRVRRAKDESALATLARQFGELWDDACAEAARARLVELAERRAAELTTIAARWAVRF